MKNNRELMELAAKAANLKFDFRGLYGVIPAIFLDDGEAKRWEPLADDGDALRLAVKLGLDVLPFAAWEEGQPSVTVRNGAEIYVLEAHGSDPNAATRRAIVRVAAEIGERMP